MERKKLVPEVMRSGLPGLWRLQRQMDQMFDRFFGDFFGTAPLLSSEEEFGHCPACDLKETDTHYLVTFDLPGVKKDDIHISVRDHMLSISGERKEEKTKEAETGLGRERFYGEFQRSFMLPSSVEAENVEANYQDGVLYVTIPKVEGAKPQTIRIAEGKPKFISEKKAEKAA